MGQEPSRFAEAKTLYSLVDSLSRNSILADQTERLWTDERHQKMSTLLGHRDINAVMLATCSEPDSFLEV